MSNITASTETNLTMTSTIRMLVEELRMDILRWLRKRWVGVRQEGGFNALEGWAVKEISGGKSFYFYFMICFN